MLEIWNSIYSLWELVFPSDILLNFQSLLQLITVFIVISLIVAIIVLPFIKLFKFIFGGN